MVHWSCKRITSSPSAPGTGLSDRQPASGRYDHRWNERWKALTRRVSWSNSILWKCIFLCIVSDSSWIGHEVMMLLQTDWWMSGWMVTFSVSGWSKWLFISEVCCMCGSNKHEMCRESIFLSWYISSGRQNAAPKQEEISRRSQAVLRMTTAYWRCLCRFVVNSPVGVWEAVNTLQLSDWVMQVKGDLSSTHQLKRRES